MKIRYFARPLPALMVGEALVNPGALLDDGELWESWVPSGGCPTALVLDEAWRDLQMLLGESGQDPPRPSYELVRGAATYSNGVIHPYNRVLDPMQVCAIAGDLATADLQELYQHCLPMHSPDWATIMDSRRGYVEHYLAAAAGFSTSLAFEGMGMVYSIR